MPEPFSRIAALLRRLHRAVWPRPASFSRRLTLSVALTVFLTTLLGALSAVLAIKSQHSGFILFGASVVIGLLCILGVLALNHQITLALHRLVDATRGLCEGDLEQPIPTQNEWIEINQLADQLEILRRSLHRLDLDSQSEKKLVMRALSAAPEGLIRIAPDGQITSVNPGGEAILGWPAAKILHQHYTNVFRPVSGSASTLHDIFAPPPGLPPTKRLAILDADDHLLTLAVTATWIEPIASPSEPTGRLLIFRRAEEDIFNNRLNSEFLANLAHEFRTPLSSITATIELLSEESSSMSESEVAELANTALLGTHHLQTLIDNVLESAVIEADCFRLRCHAVLLRDILQRAAHIMSPLLKRRKQSLRIEAPEAFHTIYADTDRLCQAIVNLLDNASKYSPFNSTIEILFTKEDQKLLCSVLDSGPGVPAEQQNDLFKRFASSNNLQGAHFGIGLGLPVVKTIIEAHGGLVGAENRPGGGARFWFTLPLNLVSNEPGQDGENPDCG